MIRPQDCPAYILAGGKSKRFGSDKSLVQVGGQPLLLRLRDQLQAVGHEVRVVAESAAKYQSLGIESIADVVPDAGPMSGLVSALRDRKKRGSGWLLLLACDQVEWCNEWFFDLAAKALESGQATALLLPTESKKRIQPLPSLWHSHDLPFVERSLLETQGRALHALLDESHCISGGERVTPFSFNNQTELKAALQRIDYQA